jgi:ABC-type multidrug transport system ATPase subunit
MLVAEGLIKRYGSHAALDNFCLTVAEGEIVGLLGGNGAGKTTFVEVVTGLTRPDEGLLTLNGIDVLRHSRAARSRLGVSPQESALYPSATVREHLELFTSLAGLWGRRRRRAIPGVAEELQLTDVLDRQVGVLSGGQKRRVQAATALVADPSLLLLDEPTAGADPQTRAALLAAVRRRAAAGAMVVYTTHYLPELSELDASIAVARSGRIIARGDQATLLKEFPDELRIRFTAAVTPPVPAGIVERAHIVGEELRIVTDDPAADLATLLAAGWSPTAVDIHRPGLDELYSALAAEEDNDG